MKFNVQQIIAIFMFFLFASVLFGVILRKLNNIQRRSGSINRSTPNYIFHDDTPYTYPHRTIDVNFRGVDTSPSRSPTRWTPDTSGDADLAMAIAMSLGTENIGSGGFGGSGGARRRVDIGSPGRTRVEAIDISGRRGGRGARGARGARGPGMARMEGGQGVALGQPGYVGGIHGIRGSVEPYVNYENFSGSPLII